VAVLCLGQVDTFYEKPMLEQEGWARRQSLDQMVFENGWTVDFEHGVARPESLEMLDRSDPALIGVAEELGQNAGAPGTELRIIELPEDAKRRVRTICGFEFLQLSGACQISGALIPAR
jgi:hypothetical protein